jgi:hypothetical protein
MQALEVLQIAIEKWIFVVPLDLKGNRSRLERPDVIDLVRLCFSLLLTIKLLKLLSRETRRLQLRVFRKRELEAT